MICNFSFLVSLCKLHLAVWFNVPFSVASWNPQTLSEENTLEAFLRLLSKSHLLMRIGLVSWKNMLSACLSCCPPQPSLVGFHVYVRTLEKQISGFCCCLCFPPFSKIDNLEIQKSMSSILEDNFVLCSFYQNLK